MSTHITCFTSSVFDVCLGRVLLERLSNVMLSNYNEFSSFAHECRLFVPNHENLCNLFLTSSFRNIFTYHYIDSMLPRDLS